MFISYSFSYLKYYNAPLIENSPITNLKVTSINGLTSIIFERELIVQSINNPTSIFDMRQNHYIAIGAGNLINGVVQTHTEYPVFTNVSYNLTKIFPIKAILSSGPDLSGSLNDSINSATPSTLSINNDSMQTSILSSTVESITDQVTSNQNENFSISTNLMETTSTTHIEITSTDDVILMTTINQSLIYNDNSR